MTDAIVFGPSYAGDHDFGDDHGDIRVDLPTLGDLALMAGLTVCCGLWDVTAASVRLLRRCLT